MTASMAGGLIPGYMLICMVTDRGVCRVEGLLQGVGVFTVI
jgi:hypothetical protein